MDPDAVPNDAVDELAGTEDCGRSKDGKRCHSDSVGEEGAPEKRSRGMDRSSQPGIAGSHAPQRLSCIWSGGPSHKFDSPVKGHPIFNIPVCYECIFEYFTGDFTSDEVGENECFCRCCGDGGDIIMCDHCRFAFCAPCLTLLAGPKGVTNAKKAQVWYCIVCEPSPFLAYLTRSSNCTTQWKQTDFPAIPETRLRAAFGKQARKPLPTYTLPPLTCTRMLPRESYQPMWWCPQCSTSRHVLFCEACVTRCHAEHGVIAKGAVVGTCSCADAPDRCQWPTSECVTALVTSESDKAAAGVVKRAVTPRNVKSATVVCSDCLENLVDFSALRISRCVAPQTAANRPGNRLARADLLLSVELSPAARTSVVKLVSHPKSAITAKKLKKVVCGTPGCLGEVGSCIDTACYTDYRPKISDVLVRRRGCALFVTFSDGSSVLCKMPRFENFEKASRKGIPSLQALWDSCLLAYVLDLGVPPKVGGEALCLTDRPSAACVTCPYCDASFEMPKLMHAHLILCPVASCKQYVEETALDPALALLLADVSGGYEKAPIPVINEIDDDYSTLLPEGFKYICTPVFSTWVPSYERTLTLPDNVNAAFAAATPRGMSFIPPKEAVPRPHYAPYGSGLPCCSCVDVCVFPTCECMRRNKGAVYTSKGLLRFTRHAIFECGWRCGCNPKKCANRVVQKGIRLPLEVFKTDKKGWGLRSPKPIPAGTFVCEYVGELLTDAEAEHIGKSRGDAYLFDLDYKAVEESFDMDAIGGEDDDVEKLAQEAAQLKPRPLPGEVEVEPASYLGKRVRVDKASTAAIQRFGKKLIGAEGTVERARYGWFEVVLPKLDSKLWCRLQWLKVFADDGSEIPDSSPPSPSASPSAAAVDEDEDSPNEIEKCIDANIYANVARFLNHSCDWNLEKQSVFYDSLDITVPHMAFFAAQDIEPYTELTFNYGYKPGTINGRRMECHCGSLTCQGFLLSLRTGTSNRALGSTAVAIGDALYIAGGWPPKTHSAVTSARPAAAVSPSRPTARLPLPSGRFLSSSRGTDPRATAESLDSDRFLGRFVISKVSLGPCTVATTVSLSPYDSSIEKPRDEVTDTAVRSLAADVPKPLVPTLELSKLQLAVASAASAENTARSRLGQVSLIVTQAEDRAGHVCIASKSYGKAVFFGGQSVAFGSDCALISGSATLLLDCTRGTCEPVCIPLTSTEDVPEATKKLSAGKSQVLAEPEPIPWPQPRIHSAGAVIVSPVLNDAEEADFKAKIAKANAAALAGASAALEKARKAAQKAGTPEDELPTQLELPTPTPIALPFIPAAPSGGKKPAAGPSSPRPVVEVGVLFGGETASGDLLNDTWLFSFDTSVWKAVEPLGGSPCPRKLHTITQLPCGNRIALFGGHDGKKRLNDLWTFNMETRMWQKLAVIGEVLPPPRCMHASFTLPSLTTSEMLGIEAGAGEVAPKDWLVVFGGSVEGGWDDKLYVVDLSDPLQKQPVLWSTIRTKGDAPKRHGHTVIAIPSSDEVELPLTTLPSQDTGRDSHPLLSPARQAPIPSTLRHRSSKWPPVVPFHVVDGHTPAVGAPFDVQSMTASYSLELEPMGPDSFREVEPAPQRLVVVPRPPVAPPESAPAPRKQSKRPSVRGKSPNKSPGRAKSPGRSSSSPHPKTSARASSPSRASVSASPTQSPRPVPLPFDPASVRFIVVGGRGVNGPTTEVAELLFETPKPSHVQDDVTPWASVDPTDADFGCTVLPDSTDRRRFNDKRFLEGDYLAYPDGNYVGEESGGNREGTGECRYTDGSVYIGQWSGNVRHGLGECWYANGDYYSGLWCDDMYEGSGRLLRERTGRLSSPTTASLTAEALSGMIEYEGDWHRGMKHGEGTAVFANDMVYRGAWSDDVPHGRGSYQSRDGRFGWQGNWSHGVLNGEGCDWKSDGEQYKGSYVGGVRDGEGRCEYADGSIYTGSWRSNRRNGSGLCEFASKLVYSGKWVADLPNGKGTCEYPTGHMYDGMWRNGLRHGEGRYVTPEGVVFDGLWRNDLRHGPGCETHPDGSVVNATWVKDALQAK